MKKHKHGGDVYSYQNCTDFSANCNPLGTPKSVKEAIRESLGHLAEYPQVGCGPLKEAIGTYEGVPSEYLICGNGAAELIFILCRARTPKKALILAPTFAEYEQALESVGCETEYFYLKEEEGFLLGESYLEAVKDGIDMIFLCNPNNPTGILTNRDLLEKILDICRKKKILMAVDECFLDFVKQPETFTLKGLLAENKNLVLLKAFTKRYAMAGVRLGYAMCADKELLETMERMTQPWNVSTMAQAAGIAALGEYAYVQEGRKLVFAEAAYLKEELRRLGLTIFSSEANYIFFRGPQTLFADCVKKGLLIRDCSNYPGLTAGYFRIAVRQHEDNKKLIRALEDILSGTDRV